MGWKVLLIEDDSHAARLVQLILRRHDIDVLIGENGRRGIQIAETEAPDLILLDLMLPDLDGFGVLASLQANEKTAQIPIVVVSASVRSEDRELALDLGVKAYLAKPYRPDELLSTVQSVLSVE